MPIEERNGETIYVSRIRLVQKPDKIRDAHIEGFDEPLTFGVHEGIRRVYGLPAGAEIKDEHPATLDHLVAALAGWMTGTLSGALAARGIETYPEADVEGVVQKIDRTIVVTDVKLTYHLTVPKGTRQTAERAVAVHEQGCPVYQTLQRGINVQWSADITEE